MCASDSCNEPPEASGVVVESDVFVSWAFNGEPGCNTSMRGMHIRLDYERAWMAGRASALLDVAAPAPHSRLVTGDVSRGVDGDGEGDESSTQM